MRKYLLQIVIMIGFCVHNYYADGLNIIPEPKEVNLNGALFNLKNTEISIEAFFENKPIAIAIDEIRDILKEKFNAAVSAEAEKKLILELSNNSKLCEEGYKLVVKEKLIAVTANTNKGLFYGLQSLKQLLKDPGNTNYLPGFEIVDFPDYKVRAISDDISRGPIPTLDFMKMQIRRLAEMKVNTIIHYVEHVVKTKSHPEFAPEDGSLTIEEWKEIANYALDYNITIVGGFQSFGHFNKILETPEYAHLGECGSLISPVMEESYQFLEDIYSEMIPVFHSPYFNINCDETFDLGKEKSKALVDSLGYAEVFYRHIMRLYKIVTKYDKQVIMWGDILLEHPELLEKLPKDILIGTWTYDPLDNFDDFIQPIKDAGFEFWVVPGLLNSRRIYPNYYQAPKNIRNFARDGKKYGASGLMNCFWDDGGASLFTVDWYGAAYGAEKSWNVKSSETGFDKRFNITVYGDRNNTISKVIWKLNELAALEPTDGLNDKVMFEKILPDSGQDMKLSLIEWDVVETICKEAEEIIKKNDAVYYKDEIEYHQLITDIYMMLAKERFDLFSAANSYKEAVDLQMTDVSRARGLVRESIVKIAGIIERLRQISDRFEYLWLKENHTYAVDWVTAKYDKKITEFKDLKNRLMSSLKLLDSSKELLNARDVRLSITKLPGKYFNQWMVVNPVVTDGNDMMSADYLQDMSGESTANPKVTQELYWQSQKMRWRRYVSPYPDVVDVRDKFKDAGDNSVMYAFANLSVENDTTVTASVGFDEEIEVFLNGRSVFKSSQSEGFIVDREQFELDLPKGKNNLLVKSANKSGDWEFSFRLPGSKVRNSKNRYKILR